MGTNNWTPLQWRQYNSRTGDRHVARRSPPIRQGEILAEDLAQQRELHRISRRKVDDPDAYRRREMAFIKLTRPLVYVVTGTDDDNR